MKILDRLPISLADTLAFVRDESVRIKEAEIIVWVSVVQRMTQECPATAFRFPAILDTGHTHYFAIQEKHLIHWAGINPERLPAIGHVRHGKQRLPLHAANLWLHHNESGKSTLAIQSHRVVLTRGITVYPSSADYPRLPLVGLRTLLSNDLYLTVDGEHPSVNLRTPDWRTNLLHWLA